YPVGAHGCRRSRPYAWLGIFADDGGGAVDQLQAPGRSAELKDLILAFRRRHRPLSRPHLRLSSARAIWHRTATAPQPPAASAVRAVSRSALVLRRCRLGRPGPSRRIRRTLGALRLTGTSAVAPRLRHRLSASRARAKPSRGLCRGCARARRQRSRSCRWCQCRKTHSRSQTPACASAGGQGAGMNDKPAATETAAFDPARAGWKIAKPIGFGELVGPIWRNGDARFGFLVETKHLNFADIVLGGMLTTLADQAMGMTALRASGNKPHARIELNIQFVGAVRLNEFVE